MKFRANVAVPGKSNHSLATIADGEIRAARPLGSAKWLEIVEDSGAFYLHRFSESGDNVGDTWHQSKEEAQAQAEFEFGVRAQDWTEA